MEQGESWLVRVARIAVRECRRMVSNRIYMLAMLVFPVIVALLFTTLMRQGQPTELPVGVVDLDNTSTTRQTIRTIDAFQGTRVAAHYATPAKAREAMQRGEIYGFILFPAHLTADLAAGRQPFLSYYYSNTSITAGSLTYRDLKTAATLLMAGGGQATLRANGLTDKQIETLIQPIKVDLHPIANPWVNYNFYLSVMMVPGCLLLFVFLITAYTLGCEVKDSTAQEWYSMAGENTLVAILGKVFPIFVVYSVILLGFFLYAYGLLGFPHGGSLWTMAWLSMLSVAASIGFGALAFEMIPSLRMSMSVCSLWAVLSFSMVGTAYPVFAMDGALQSIAWLFPLRHYFVIYASSVFNGFPVAYSWWHVAALVAFACLPLLGLGRVGVTVRRYKYLE